MSEKIVKVGNLNIGGKDIIIQSMTNTKTTDIDKTVEQILQLEKAGCDLVRCSIPDKQSAQALSSIIKSVHRMVFFSQKSTCLTFWLFQFPYFTFSHVLYKPSGFAAFSFKWWFLQ